MEPVKVRACPPARTFSSITAAVAHAISHPRLSEAQSDAAQLHGALFVDACWTLYEWIIRFDYGLSLCVWVEGTEIRWALKPSSAVLTEGKTFERIGAAPLLLDWTTTLGLWKMDCSSLVAKRRGARFKDLFVSDHGLFLYLHECLILQFGRAERVADGQSIIYVYEDD
jgi:hypothetical protein